MITVKRTYNLLRDDVIRTFFDVYDCNEMVKGLENLSRTLDAKQSAFAHFDAETAELSCRITSKAMLAEIPFFRLQ